MDPDTLLSIAELSRIQWKRGAYDGEMLVEVDTVEKDECDWDTVNHGRSSTLGFYTTEVGVYDDIPLPVPGTMRTGKDTPFEIGDTGELRIYFVPFASHPPRQ